MTTRPTYNVSEFSNPAIGAAGDALTLAFMGQSMVESNNKRRTFQLSSIGNGELWIDGIQNFRFQAASRSSFVLRGQVVYYTDVIANAGAYDVTVAGRCTGGAITLFAAATVTKIGGTTSALAVAASSDKITFTGTPGGGDTNVRWYGNFSITEVTDEG